MFLHNMQMSSQICVHKGLAMAIPQGMYVRLASCSSLAIKGIEVGAGVIDNDYRGEIKVVLKNTTNSPFHIPLHSRISQCIFEGPNIYTEY